jgi:CO/xanthine dehydrogenase FAD-binding subunit
MTETPRAYSVETLADAYAVLAEHGDRVRVIAGGTDLMVLMNAHQLAANDFLDIWRVRELRGISDAGGHLRIGALTTYTELICSPLVQQSAPALVAASRTVGAVQIQNRGTLGGNVVNASPAGDSLPVLAAFDARIVLRSRRGERRLPFGEFMTGPKRSARAADEIVVGAEWSDPGPAQTFLKVGTRNAMVIAVASLCLVIDRARRAVRVALGSCGPTIMRAREAEAFAGGLIDEAGWDSPLDASEASLRRFGELVATAARPIDDVRGSARYRRHVLAVMARRALSRVGGIV